MNPDEELGREIRLAMERGQRIHEYEGRDKAFGDLCREVVELQDAIRSGVEVDILGEAKDCMAILERIRRNQ